MSGRIELPMMQADALHPYWPANAPVRGYEPNQAPLWLLLACFAAILGIVVSTSLFLARRANSTLSRSDGLYVAWFVLCGTLHCFFEGFYVLNYRTLASSQSLFGQLWKEYALSDSRYLTSDPFMLCIESITVVFWGPLCYAIAICIGGGSPLRYPLQIIMGLGHLFGCVLYYSTSLTELYLSGVSHSRPEPLYFWGYYIGFNFPWIIVPIVIIVQSMSAISKAFREQKAFRAFLADADSRQQIAGLVGITEAKKSR